MSDPVLALILIASFFFAIVAAHWFKTLDNTSLGRDARVPVIAGLLGGILLCLRELSRTMEAAAVAGVMFAIALYVRHVGRESEPTDGMTLGALTGMAAAVPLVIMRDEPLLHVAECILAGAIAGYGLTWAHVLRNHLVDAATAALTWIAAALPLVLVEQGVQMRQLATGAVALVPLLLVIAAFQQTPTIRAELSEEMTLGFMDQDDVASTAHPLRRLGRAGWHDAAAHREFVRIARTIALRKRQQRGRSEEAARLYQLEVIKLRMQLQEMSRIDRAMRAHAERATP